MMMTMMNESMTLFKGQCHELRMCHFSIETWKVQAEFFKFEIYKFKMALSSRASRDVSTREIWLQWKDHVIKTQEESCHEGIIWRDKGIVLFLANFLSILRRYFHEVNTVLYIINDLGMCVYVNSF